MGNLINRTIEELKVQASYQGKLMDATRKDILGHWSVFLFYPADLTFVCPTELRDLTDFYEEFKAARCEIYSASEDTHLVHKAWADASDTIKKIQYPILRDPTGKLARELGVPDEEGGQAFWGVFILNPEGRTKAYKIHDMGIGRNAQELLRKVQTARSVEEHGDQVCPAERKPGEETLTPNLGLVGMLQGGGGYD